MKAEDFVKLKFIGGKYKKGAERGPWLSYEEGEITVLPKRFANKAAYPHFEYVGPATEDEIEEPWRSRLGLDKGKIEKIVEKYGLEEYEVKDLLAVLRKKETSKKKSKPKPKPELELEPESEKEPEDSEPEDFEVTASTEVALEVEASSSLSISPTSSEMIRGMDDNVLRAYIMGQGGKVDGRWGRKKLIERALELQ